MSEKRLKKIYKYLKIGFFSGNIVLISIVLFYFAMPKIMDVGYIRKHPELFNRNIILIGRVHILDDNPTFFMLVDLNGNKFCKAIPVAYKGQRPDVDSEVIVYGQVKKIDNTSDPDILWWEYLLDAKKINTRKDNFSGNFSYSLRQSVYELGIRLKRKNIKLYKLIRNLIPLGW